MKNNTIKRLSAAAATTIMLCCALSCAKENTTTTNDKSKAYLDAWLQLNHPEAIESGNGIYILNETEGKGRSYSGEVYVILDYTTTDLKGNITSTTDKKLSQQTGTYSVSTYYGPQVMLVSESTMPEGLEEMISTMSLGGKMTAVVPSWLNVYKRYKKPSDYYKHSSDNSNSIFTIHLKDFTDDIIKWEADSLERYSQKYLNDTDSTGYGFYYRRTAEPTDTISIKKDTTVYIDYIGRLLNGLVFDTTIADTAKFYGIYDASKTYSPVSVAMAENYDNIAFSSSSSSSDVITGFKMMLSKMHSGESGTGVFMSAYGYQSSGSGSSIPPYSSLRFDISLVPEPEDE